MLCLLVTAKRERQKEDNFSINPDGWTACHLVPFYLIPSSPSFILLYSGITHSCVGKGDTITDTLDI